MHHRLWGMRVGRGPKLHHPPRKARKVTECVQRIQNYAPMMSSSPSVGYWSGVFILSSGVLILSNENQGRGRANSCKNSSLAGCAPVRCFGLSVIRKGQSSRPIHSLGLVHATRHPAVRGRASAPGRPIRPRALLRPWGAADWRGSPNVRLPLPIPAFRAQGRLSQLSAINRHNRQLFDLLVGAQQDRWGYGKAERLGGLEVDDHLELGRQLHREIARLLAAQDAIDIGGGTTRVVYLVDSVGEQATVSNKVRLRIDRRYVVSGRRRYNRRAMRVRECTPHADKTPSRLAPKGDDGRFDLRVAMNRRND